MRTLRKKKPFYCEPAYRFHSLGFAPVVSLRARNVNRLTFIKHVAKPFQMFRQHFFESSGVNLIAALEIQPE